MTPVEIQHATEDQADFAIRAADLLLFVADGREGLVALDETLAVKFRKMGKNPILVVNKMDEAEKGYSISEFARLGFEQTVAISAEHGLGIDQLLSTIKDRLPPAPPSLPKESEIRTRIAFIGRPSVGANPLYATVFWTRSA